MTNPYLSHTYRGENFITHSFACIFRYCGYPAWADFLRQCLIEKQEILERLPKPMPETDFSIKVLGGQFHRESGKRPKKISEPDARIIINGEVAVMIESKIGNYVPNRVQIENHFKKCPTSKLLLLITSNAGDKESESWDSRIVHLTWKNVRSWVKQFQERTNERAERKLLDDLLLYWKLTKRVDPKKVFK